MSEHSAVTPSSFNVTCPGCGLRLRFSMATEMPARVRVQCSSCKAAFGVRRPGGAPPAPVDPAATLGAVPPTYLAFPVHNAASTGAASVLPSVSATTPSAIPRRPEEPGFAPGETLAGRYRVAGFIARGGMGEVYEVDDLELRERVALKTVRPEVARDTFAVERFRREIQLARKVTHPNACRIFDVSHHRDDRHPEGVIFLTMELLAGETLAQRLQRGGPLTPAEALPVARQVAEALDAAHQAGIVHRDLKPGNVMLVEGRSGTRAVVTDFGLARLESGNEGGLTLTAAAAVVGTPAYLAPEQVEGAEVTAAADVYSFGILLYEMITGKVPFLGDNALSTAAKRLREAPVPPRVHAPGLDPRWEAAILRCLERSPENRFASAPEAVAAILAPVPVPEPVTTPILRPAPVRKPPAKPRAARQWILLAALLALAAALGVYRYGQWKAAQESASGRILALPVENVVPRRSLAVLGFKDLSGNPGTAWLSPALAEMLSTELAAGGGVRVVAGENVARARVELGLENTNSLAPDTLARLRKILGTDAVVLGSYVAIDGPSGRKIRLDLLLQDTARGETTARMTETGEERQLFDLVSRVGRRLRRELGTEEISGADSGEVRAALPSSPEAARLYAQGIERLRTYDPVGARDLLARAVAAEPGNAMGHSALAAAWAALGYDGRARDEAKAAFDLAGNLPREERLLIEGRYREATQDWDRAAQTYWKLWSLFPDSLEHGLRLAAVQTAAGRIGDALATVKALRTLPAPFSDDPRIDLAEAVAAGALPDFQRQRTAAGRAAGRGKALGAPMIMAQARLLECRALRNLGKPAEALAACEEGRGLHARAGDRAGVAEALTHSANVLYDRGDLAGASRFYEQALETYREIGNRGAEAGALNNIAVVLRHQGDLDRARDLYGEVLAISREIGSRGGEAFALNNLSGVLLRRGDLAAAARGYEQALAIRRELRDQGGEASALDNLGVTLRRKGDLAAARRRHEEALAIRRRIGQKIGEIASLNNLGSVLLDQGELAAARRSFGSARSLGEQTRNWSAYASALFGLGEVAAREGKLAEALKLHEEAFGVRDKIGERGAAAESRLALASMKLASGDAAGADSLARLAFEELGRQGATGQQAVALAVSALSLESRRDAPRARETVARAAALIQGNQELRPRLFVELAAARLKGGGPAALRGVADQAARAGLLELRLLAELALADAAGPAERPDRLAAVAQQARTLGYGAIAREAAARGGTV